MSHQLAVRLPDDVAKRLDELAAKTGRTKTFYVREAIKEYLADLEDYYLAADVAERVRIGEEDTVPLDDLIARYDVEN